MKLLKHWYLFLLFFVFIIPLFFGQFINLYIDWLWFGAVGFSQVFLKVLTTKIWLALGLGAVFFAAVYLNVLAARIITPKAVWVVKDNVVEIPDVDKYRKMFDKFLLAGVAFFTLVVAGSSSTLWEQYLKFVNWQPFSILDPIFGKDIGFFVFQLPFIKSLYSIAMLALVISAMVITVYYFLFGSIRVTRKGLKFARAAEVHFSVLGAAFFLLVSYGFRMGMYDLLYSGRGVIFGAGFTDVNATLPILWMLFFISIAVAGAFIVNMFLTGWKAPAAVFGVLLLFLWIVKPIYPEIVQKLYVSPNEIAKESPYIKLNIEYTRKAYKLDKVTEREFPVEENLTLASMRANEGTVGNIRLWDYRPLLSTYGQIQEIRTYYDFVDVDIDRYTMRGKPVQVMLSARELNYNSLPSKIWINEHLTYTHGYGVALSPVNRVTKEGLPSLLIKDIPPSFPKDIKLLRPEIYYGEIANDYVFVNTKAKEFDYPAGEKNVYTEYEGSGGIPVSSMFRKLLFAMRFGTPKIFFSSDIKKDSKMMMYRRIRERVAKVTPFFRYDRDPYIIVADGGLFWVLDAYTVTDMYPYSEPYPGLGNYIRNSAKIVVDAYNGSIKYYVSDPADPLIQTYSKIFPGVFLPMEKMPEDIRAHVRYPEIMFAIQSRKFSVYHMTDPQVFYNKEDKWAIAKETFERDVRVIEPYYTIMKLPGERREEFILMIPFTPVGKDNMSAWMCVRCDEEKYGELLVFKFPKRKLIYGPLQIEARIDQDPEISKLLSLWSQRGSSVIRGNMLVIPIENSLLYVEPLYLKAERGQLPELKRVIVSYAGRIAMEESLEMSLQSIFGGKVIRMETAPAIEGEADDLEGLIKKAGEHFRRAGEFQRQGNWRGYGEEMEKLGEVLRKMDKLKN
jgi:uncharacterized membrane protein (UPF0182 family)